MLIESSEARLAESFAFAAPNTKSAPESDLTYTLATDSIRSLPLSIRSRAKLCESNELIARLWEGIFWQGRGRRSTSAHNILLDPKSMLELKDPPEIVLLTIASKSKKDRSEASQHDTSTSSTLILYYFGGGVE